MSEDKFTVEYTNKDIIDKIDSLHNGLKKHINKTTVMIDQNKQSIKWMEGKSVGVWASRNPIKFVAATLSFIGFLISDVRHPVVEFFSKIL